MAPGAGGKGEAVRRVLDAVVRHFGVHHACGEGGRRFGRLGRTLGLFVGVLRLANLVRPRLPQTNIIFKFIKHTIIIFVYTLMLMALSLEKRLKAATAVWYSLR